ncbi:MAG: hypothetical protein GQ574_16475 [Crocinitomix sp.]|nr:hypothetical protein [Crocinitomix sp.]
MRNIFAYIGVLIIAFSCNADVDEQVNEQVDELLDVENAHTDSVSINNHDLALQSSINYTHELCGDYDFGSTGVIRLNSKSEIIFDTPESLGNGKFILVGSEVTESSIYKNYDEFLVLRNKADDVFWCSIDGHFFDNEPIEYMYDRKRIFVHHVAFLGEDSTALEIPIQDGMIIE